MSMKSVIFFLLFVLASAGSGFAQYDLRTYRTLNVLDGLPQAFVSGIVQDPQGFIWIGTRDGLARYDGRQFKSFRHESDDRSTIADNIVSKLYMDSDGLLWIFYEDGGLDVLHTQTEEITHVSALESFKLLENNFKADGTMIQDNTGRHWIMGRKGRVFILDLARGRLDLHTAASLFPTLGEDYITGIAKVGDDVLLMLNRSMVYVGADLRIQSRIVFQFENSRLYDSQRDWKDTSPVVRSNGDVVFMDFDRLVFFERARDRFTVFPLPAKRYYTLPTLLLDAGENVIIAYHNMTCLFDRTNRLTWVDEELENERYIKTAIYLDRSGVLWEGSNGYGIRQFDIYLTQMPSQRYVHDFPADMLLGLGVDGRLVERTFVHRMNPYFFRWTAATDGRIWMAKSGADTAAVPNLLVYQGGALQWPRFTYKDHPYGANQGIEALAISPEGRLWGLDYRYRPVAFDTVAKTATVHAPIDHRLSLDKLNEVNGMVMDGEDTFWICSRLGLLRHDLETGLTTRFFDRSPAVHLLAIQRDPFHAHVLWLGTYADGLIRFDKRTGEHRFFKMRDGLPNNTVYAMLADADGAFWCSSNKGVFSFHPETHQVNNYLPQGTTPLIECNRFHYFAYPDGRLSFGGTGVYTRFAPEAMRDDDHQPNTVLTGIFINNRPAAYRDSVWPLDAPLNTMKALRLPHYRNFLSFEFAGLQYNAPEKLRYRYILEGIDADWVSAGNRNVATYTGIPPGRYRLRINASNTSGIWSDHVKELEVVIVPPFWKTWWFISLVAAGIGSLVFFLIDQRLRAIRRKDQQQLAFERETMELEARALRSQMNPHFIFNCLNSIKSLIQQRENETAATYLTTFAKLIRNQLSNAQKEVTLQEELDTCKLYAKLESLRFDDRITCEFVVDPDVNLATVRIPPLTIQPFVENAIIHGILPKPGPGRITVSVCRRGEVVVCLVDDDGIGRQRSAQLNQRRRNRHRSKGALLVENRVRLHNTLNRYNIEITVNDKVDREGNPTGTSVSLTINLPL